MEKTIEVSNKAGIHVRPAAKIDDLANKFSANIYIIKDEIEVNAKSIMDLLTLVASEGTKITIKAKGTDEVEAINQLEKLIRSKFSEE